MASSKPIQAIKTECAKHGQYLNLYCPSHLLPCCDKCISTSHSKCTGIKSLAGVVEQTKIEKSKESVEKDINSVLNSLETIINHTSININTGENQCISIQKSIKEIRQEINKHLDHLEKKLYHELDTIWNQEKLKATDFISEIEGKKKNLKEIKEHLQTVTTNYSKLQSFLGVHTIEQQVHQCQRYVADLCDGKRAKEFEIKMKQNDEIEKIQRKLGSLTSLGEVTVVKTEIAMNRETSLRRKAQVETNINSMTMNIEIKIEINIRKEISDMICLIDGRVIVVERFGKVNLLTPDGKLQKQLPIPGEPYSVTQVNQNTIAITYSNEKVIKIFNMENETVTKVIKLGKSCYGLSFSNSSLAVGLHSDEIRIIDLEGNTQKSIQVRSELSLFQLVFCNGRVIYSDYIGKAVYCYDGSGEQIWQYKQDLSRPMGLCADNYGNIIVADLRKIIVISKDGQKSNELIRKGDELKRPKTICFKHESSGFICEEYGEFLAKFNLCMR